MTEGRVGLQELLRQLKASYGSISWQRRCGIVKLLATAVDEGDRSGDIMELIEILSVDPKWEVRRGVADLLVHLPDEYFTRIASVLSDDSNAFVCNAARLALDRRRRGQRIAKHAKHGFDQAMSQYMTIEKMYGKKVSTQARKMAEQLFDHMVGTTVHEMRSVITPLKAGASNLLQHLDKGAPEPNECRRILMKVIQRVTFLERLLSDMQGFSQVPTMKRRRERLSELVTQTLVMVDDSLKADGCSTDGIQVEVAVPENITLDVCRHQIMISLKNVIKNAFDAVIDRRIYCQPGHIAISARPVDDEAVEIHIEDNGISIDAEDLAEIRQFIPGKTTKRNRGTGFGLPIAKRYIELHGGSIGIDSHENEGTRVIIVLPLESPGGINDEVQGACD